jgi:hypothetical protein
VPDQRAAGDGRGHDDGGHVRDLDLPDRRGPRAQAQGEQVGDDEADSARFFDRRAPPATATTPAMARTTATTPAIARVRTVQLDAAQRSTRPPAAVR